MRGAGTSVSAPGLAPVSALFLFFLPRSGAGYFGLNQGSRFTLYLLLVNLPYGLVTALTARAIIGTGRAR